MDARPSVPQRDLFTAPVEWLSQPHQVQEVWVDGICLDSRRVQPGDIYAALPGENVHGAQFVAQAVHSGARAVVTDPVGAERIPQDVPVFVVADPRSVLGELSAWIYDSPADKLQLVGITGTNGKTTISYLLFSCFQAAGFTAGLIGTTGIRVAEQELPSPRTTPEAPDVHRILALMVERGVTHAAVEVSSHALILGRVDGVRFTLGTFTNLSQDHLDFHGSMAEYFAAKMLLLTPERSQQALIFTGDDWGQQAAQLTELPTQTYGPLPADWTLTNFVPGIPWQATIRCADLAVPVRSPLVGEFNQKNVLGAVAALTMLGVTTDHITAGIAACVGVPGRMELVDQHAPFATFVDYAHTPDAVARVVSAARQEATGKVIVVLGCGGDRDHAKREPMGLAAAPADSVIVTDDNPRSEDPAVIRAAVLRGVHAGQAANWQEIADREEAINAAIQQAQAGDWVLVLGKGHEQGQDVAGVITPFDDRLVARAAIARNPT